MNRKLLYLAPALLVVAAVNAFVFGFGQPAPKQTPRVAEMLGVPATSHQIRLFGGAAARGQSAPAQDTTHDYFQGPDFRRLAFSHILNKSGTMEDDQYYPGTDKVKMYSQDYYAAVNDDLPRLHGAAMYEPDGVTYKKHIVRRVNGSIERTGQRLRDGRYETRYMFDDPAHLDLTTPERIRYFDSALHFSNETIYAWNNDHSATYVSAKIVRGDYEGSFYVSMYRESGSLAATLKHMPGTDTGVLYDEDGSFVLAEWGNDMSSASYFNLFQRGSDTPVQVWESVTGRMRVTVLDPKTHAIVLQQLWQERPDPNKPGGKIYLLMKVGSQFQGSSPRLQVEMSGNGSHPTELITRDENGERTVRKLDQGGKKVVAVDRVDASGTEIASTLPSNEEVLHIDPLLLKIPTRPQVPTFTNFGPERIYDYP